MNPEELRKALIGAWRLVSYKATAVDDGDVVEPFGSRPQGLIVYTPSGHMSAQIMRPGRPAFREGRLERGRPEELSAAALGYLAYGGTYDVPEDDVVVHHVELSLFPNWVGVPQVRAVGWEGPRLRLALREPAPIWGALRDGVLVWERVPGSGGAPA